MKWLGIFPLAELFINHNKKLFASEFSNDYFQIQKLHLNDLFGAIQMDSAQT